MSESQIEKYLVRGVKRIGGLAPKWTSPGTRGVPDRIVILPKGRIVFVELKSSTGRLGELQKWWAKKLTALGHTVYTINSKDAVDDFIKRVISE